MTYIYLNNHKSNIKSSTTCSFYWGKQKKLSLENGVRDVFFPLIHSMGVGLPLWSAQLDPVMLMSSPHLKII